MADWTLLPAVCGQSIVQDWIGLLDISNLEDACRTHQSRATYLQWCKGAVLPHLDVAPAIYICSSVMNELLRWLHLRGMCLRCLNFEPDREFSFAALQEYLHDHGSAVTEVRVELDADWHAKSDFNMVDATLFLAQLNALCPNVRALTIQGCSNDGG